MITGAIYRISGNAYKIIAAENSKITGINNICIVTFLATDNVAYRIGTLEYLITRRG